MFSNNFIWKINGMNCRKNNDRFLILIINNKSNENFEFF